MNAGNAIYSSRESFLDPKRPIVTKTDLQGRITYVNPAFIDISEFDRSELFGQAHSIVRHPDMPADTFADMWTTVEAGAPWRGIVKNRTKSGGFYWVNAYVTPLTEKGKRIGYMSVRTAPTPKAKREAEALYRSVRQGRCKLPATQTEGGYRLTHLTAAGLLAMIGLGSAQVFLDGWQAMLALGLQAIVALALWLSIRHNAAKPMEKMLGLLADISEGNLNADVPDSGCREAQKVGAALRSMQVSLRALTADVIASASDTATEANTLHQNARFLQKGSPEQAYSDDASMERMSGVTETNLGSAGQVEHAARALEETARELKLLVAHFEQRA